MRKEIRESGLKTIYDRAKKAGIAAGNEHTPIPMIVHQHTSPFNDNSPFNKEWQVSEGVCGFAWVIIRPGNCPFANWLKKNDKGSKGQTKGVHVWIGEHGQSYERKTKHAEAFASILRENGINAYSMSRLD